MSGFRAVLKTAQLPPGKGLSVRISDADYVALFNVAGTIHAIDGSCPHRAALLGQGIFRGCVVSCPDHGWSFDVTTGQLLTGSIRVRTYEVRVEGEDVLIRLPTTG